MHNALIHGGVGSGAWNSILAGNTEFELLDERQFQSINGDLGGTWAPIAQIVIGGAGLRITGSFQADAAATFNGGIAVNAASQFTEQVTFSNHAALIIPSGGSISVVAGGTLNVSGTQNIQAGAGFFVNATGTVEFNNAPTFKNGASFNTAGAVGFAVGVTFTSTVTLQGATSNTGVITPSGGGRINSRPTFSMPDSAATVGVASGGSGNGADSVTVQLGTLSADRVLTAASASAVAGSRMIVVSNEGTFKVQIKQDNGTLIAEVKQGGSFGAASGMYRWVELEHTGAANGWFVLRGHGN